jgi:hypothetical protein
VTYVYAPVDVAVPGIAGLTVTLSEPGDGWIRLDQSEWGGNFPDGTALLYTLYPDPPWPASQRGGGPVTFDFNRPIQGFLIQVQNDFYGPFNVHIDAYDGTTLLASFDQAGQSCGAPGSGSVCTGGSPPWIGVHSDLTDITSIVLSTGGTYSSAGPNDFAFAGPLIEGTPTPESATVFPLAACLIGICLRRRRV